jgi:phage terminase small subunit
MARGGKRTGGGVLSNPRHERFAQELVLGRPASDAYVAAGFRYNEGNAIRLKGNEKVSARVAELQSRAAAAVQISREWVIEHLVENVNRAMQHVEVKDRQGKTTGEYKYDGGVANRALELLGKELGMFVDRTENTNTNYELSDELPTPEEWERRYAS